MGQVWSSADFDGMTETKHEGGCGSVLAVTAQNFGSDNRPFTRDDVLAPLNSTPASISIDKSPGPRCNDQEDRVRGFYSFHAGGAHFVYGDGSVHFIEEGIDVQPYIALSTINGREIVTDRPFAWSAERREAQWAGQRFAGTLRLKMKWDRNDEAR